MIISLSGNIRTGMTKLVRALLASLIYAKYSSFGA